MLYLVYIPFEDVALYSKRGITKLYELYERLYISHMLDLSDMFMERNVEEWPLETKNTSSISK